MYRLNKEENFLEEINETTFYENDLKERQHIEEWIRKNPEVMGEELLIIGHEYDDFENNERIDLLAIDKEGNLVVIDELQKKLLKYIMIILIIICFN